MKKTIALFILALFLISLVPVFALEDNRTLRQDKEIIKQNREAVKERAQQLKEQFENAREQLKNLREDYKKGKENVLEKLKGVKDACKQDQNATACKSLKESFFVDNFKPHLLKALDVMKEAIQKREARINEVLANPNVQNKDSLNAQLTALDAELVNLADLQTKIEAAQTKEEVKAETKSVKDEWKQVKIILEGSRGVVLTHMFDFAISRSESLEKRLDTVLAKMQADGKDVSAVQANVDSFKAHIAKAKDLVEQARTEFNSGAKEEIVKQAHQLLVQAQEEMKAAHEDLKDIVKEVKAKGGSQTDLEEKSSENEKKSEENETTSA